jgi:hypothetical protein
MASGGKPSSGGKKKNGLTHGKHTSKIVACLPKRPSGPFFPTAV